MGKKSDNLKRLYREFNGKCFYCEKRITLAKATRDHMVPLSKGGGGNRWNTVLACFDCNQAKGDKPLIDFVKGVSRRAK